MLLLGVFDLPGNVYHIAWFRLISLIGSWSCNESIILIKLYLFVSQPVVRARQLFLLMILGHLEIDGLLFQHVEHLRADYVDNTFLLTALIFLWVIVLTVLRSWVTRAGCTIVIKYWYSSLLGYFAPWVSNSWFANLVRAHPWVQSRHLDIAILNSLRVLNILWRNDSWWLMSGDWSWLVAWRHAFRHSIVCRFAIAFVWMAIYSVLIWLDLLDCTLVHNT